MPRAWRRRRLQRTWCMLLTLAALVTLLWVPGWAGWRTSGE
jgi:hypothetical protein